MLKTEENSPPWPSDTAVFVMKGKRLYSKKRIRAQNVRMKSKVAIMRENLFLSLLNDLRVDNQGISEWEVM